MRITRAGAAAGLAGVTLAVSLGVAHPAQAAGFCSRGTTKYTEVRYNAYFGHAVVANNKICIRGGNIVNSSKPTITFPSRMPAGGGETIKLTEGPDKIFDSSGRDTYRISVENGPAYIPNARQTFNFDIHYYRDGRARICFTGRACSSYQ